MIFTAKTRPGVDLSGLNRQAERDPHDYNITAYTLIKIVPGL
jgi:hypothetical protein